MSEAGEFLNERRTLDEIHREGGARFGWAWIDANRTAIEAARAIGIEPSESIRLKVLLSAVAFAFCEAAARQEGQQ